MAAEAAGEGGLVLEEREFIARLRSRTMADRHDDGRQIGASRAVGNERGLVKTLIYALAVFAMVVVPVDAYRPRDDDMAHVD